MRAPPRSLLVAMLALALWNCAARASIEEFESFDVARMEEDDENALDHYLARQPEDWRSEWERSRSGFRTSQGCLTSGQWNIEHELRTRSPLGDKALLDVQFVQVNTDEKGYQWLSLDFRYPTALGVFGWRFRPAYDKSQQDFALLWGHGDGTTPLQVEAAFTIEDMFNSLWEFRQARVGNHNEPYRAHPVEPALSVISRGKHHRYSVNGAWQTPSRKVIHDPDPDIAGTRTLWGSRLIAEAEHSLSEWSLVGRFDTERALGTSSVQSTPGNSRIYRRHWGGEVGLRRSFGPRARAELRWMYRSRTQSWAPPAGDGRLRILDRIPALEISREVAQGWRLRGGVLYDRVSVSKDRLVPTFTWGSRKESRAYIGLQAQFGRVRVQGIECVELDREPYDVSFHHDKGFLHLQTTF